MFLVISLVHPTQAAFSIVQIANNDPGSGGFLLNDSAEFVTTGVGMNLLFAR